MATTKYTRGPNWKRQRRAARLRDNNTCRHCGTTEGKLTVNHIVPFRLFSNYREANRLENLETLCVPCHSKADVAFARTHPDLFPYGVFPDVLPRRRCPRCGEEYIPKSPAAKLCGPCHVHVCQNCGSRFFSTKTAQRDIKYCSIPCQAEGRGKRGWRSLDKVCEGCGTSFTSKHKTSRWCSHACYMVHGNPRRIWAASRSAT